MEYRTATDRDLRTLAIQRWDCRAEGGEEPATDREQFVEACASFFRDGLADGSLTVWLAMDGEEIISHIIIQSVPMVPRPCRIEDGIGCITNNYTQPEYRNQGIGAKVMSQARRWAEEQDLELLFVWPSERAVPFYKRAGFAGNTDVMQLVLRDY